MLFFSLLASVTLALVALQPTQPLLQGGIDDGETPAEAAARELKEETGISQASIIAQVGTLAS